MTQQQLFERGQAVLSDCGTYRYRLDRRVADEGKVFGYFGVNPSTADATIDDQTVRKWKGFTLRNGGCRFVVGNVFAYRSRYVKQLADVADPVGPSNDWHIRQMLRECDVLVPCWGNERKAPLSIRYHFELLKTILAESGKTVLCFGLTSGGGPKHPLMLGYDTTLVAFPCK